jgi:hypothetical protein
MLSEEYRAIRNQVRKLSLDEQFQLLEDLAVILRKESQPQHSITELEGLGKEIWEGVDVEEYIRESRGPHLPAPDESKIHSSSQNFNQQTSVSLQGDKN